MALVRYSDSSESESDKATTKHLDNNPTGPNALKRKRNSEDPSPPTLPPLPDSFHNLYASGTKLKIDILSNVLLHAGKALPPDVRLHSLLTSDLGAGLPLHISLSRTLMLAADQRQSFTKDLETAIGESGVGPFSVVLKSLRWVPNHENNRSFLVLQTRKPPGDELNDLLRASNKVARSFGQPCLYIPEEAPTSGKVVRKRDEQGSSSQIKPTRQMHARLCDYGKQSEVHEDASNHFHISIGWMLESPLKTSPNTAHSIECTAAHECVSEDALVHLKSYKYSSVDKSLISRYILKHYWNGFVKILPLWLAPNMVTLLGFFCILANVILLEMFIPDLVGPAPSWLYYSFAFGLWMYSTMDNVDGKQARRTGQSSGLGELFDHGIDSLNCTLASLCETAALGLGSSPKGVFTALIPCLPMFFSTWETYHTHTLYLGYFNGPTEGLIIACSMMVLSGYYGPQIWIQPLTDLIDWPGIFGSASLIDVWFPVIFGTFLFIHLPACILNVVSARRANNLPVAPVFVEWLPIIIFTVSCAAWLYSPYSTLMQENRLVLFCVTMSFVFGRMTTKIILAHLTRQPFPLWTIMLAPLIGGALLGNLPRLGLPAVTATVELWYLRAYLVFALVVYFRWAILVINSICSYLGINCLTITPRPAQDRSTSNEIHQNGAINRKQTAKGGRPGKGD
ncbi:MAG: hypothetical protein LQ338_002538 [Usnochroma carphineum]|nr:MAG: hypothetical protein LQ338_002538 [Usnochroma carphineum]